ncbi:Cobalt-zinc-cadmium resistance protein CzcA; Cation efflux system protein CusA, partial [hydrothermal vent metagenome]
GLTQQVELKLFPPLMQQHSITLAQIIRAIKPAFEQVGGRTLELTNRDYNLRATVNTDNLDQLEQLIVARDKLLNPIRLKDLGYFQINYDLRRGIADLNGEGEVVGGIVIMEQSQNVLNVSQQLQQSLQQLKTRLPKDVEIITTYERSTLILQTLKNFSSALLYELLVVVLVIFWALRHGRASVAPVLIILLGCLYTLISLSFFGQTINLLSLAGLAIAMGEMADATIVIVENAKSELAKYPMANHSQRHEIIINSISRMMRPLLFSLLIILASFIPLFYLELREARLFDPLVYSKTFAMGFSTLLTLFLLPIIVLWIFNKSPTKKNSSKESILVHYYKRILRSTLRHRYLFLSSSVLLLIASVFLMNQFPKDYMPELEEGSILYMPTTLPGIPMREAGWILQKIDKKIKSFPEVERVFGKLGRADTSTDPAPVTMIETTILLKPKSQWREGINKKMLVDEMNASLKIMGFVNSWTQPIAGRIMMQDTGIQSPVGIKVRGGNIIEIEKVAQQIEILLREFDGTDSVIAERISQGYYVSVENHLDKMADKNVLLEEAMLTTRFGIGGDNIMQIPLRDNTTVALSMQYSPEYIDTLEKLQHTPVITATGKSVALAEIANVDVKKMPEMIRTDNSKFAAYIYINLSGVTALDYVSKAKLYLEDQLTLPMGYQLEWTGNYHYAQAAKTRLQWIIPITLLIMFALLMRVFKSVPLSFMILLSAPFALIGGVILQWFQGTAMTTAVLIGYIAVLAVAIQTGILMVEFIKEALHKQPLNQSYIDTIIEGSVLRLRPKLMTVATTVLGLIPILLATGSGMDITRPIAAPTVGGMISSTIYVLFLIPCLFMVMADVRNIKSN